MSLNPEEIALFDELTQSLMQRFPLFSKEQIVVLYEIVKKCISAENTLDRDPNAAHVITAAIFQDHVNCAIYHTFEILEVINKNTEHPSIFNSKNFTENTYFYFLAAFDLSLKNIYADTGIKSVYTFLAKLLNIEEDIDTLIRHEVFLSDRIGIPMYPSEEIVTIHGKKVLDKVRTFPESYIDATQQIHFQLSIYIEKLEKQKKNEVVKAKLKHARHIVQIIGSKLSEKDKLENTRNYLTAPIRNELGQERGFWPWLFCFLGFESFFGCKSRGKQFLSFFDKQQLDLTIQYSAPVHASAQSKPSTQQTRVKFRY